MTGPGAPHSIAEFRRGYEEEERLRGFRSRRCGFVTATWGLLCPRCGERDLDEVDLPPTGTIVAGTVQNVPADEFVNDAPYAYVIVELDGGGRVTGWMPSVRRPEQLRLGARVRWAPSYRAGVVFELAEASGPTEPEPRS